MTNYVSSNVEERRYCFSRSKRVSLSGATRIAYHRLRSRPPIGRGDSLIEFNFNYRALYAPVGSVGELAPSPLDNCDPRQFLRNWSARNRLRVQSAPARNCIQRSRKKSFFFLSVYLSTLAICQLQFYKIPEETRGARDLYNDYENTGAYTGATLNVNAGQPGAKTPATLPQKPLCERALGNCPVAASRSARKIFMVLFAANGAWRWEGALVKSKVESLFSRCLATTPATTRAFNAAFVRNEHERYANTHCSGVPRSRASDSVKSINSRSTNVS